MATAFAAMMRYVAVPAPLTVHAMLLTGIGWVYIGFALMDGRARNVVVEGLGATAFTVVAFIGLLYSPYTIAAGFAAHGFWDMLHHDSGIQTRIPLWYPPFCAVYDFAHAIFFVVLGSTV